MKLWFDYYYMTLWLMIPDCVLRVIYLTDL